MFYKSLKAYYELMHSFLRIIHIRQITRSNITLASFQNSGLDSKTRRKIVDAPIRRFLVNEDFHVSLRLFLVLINFILTFIKMVKKHLYRNKA